MRSYHALHWLRWVEAWIYLVALCAGLRFNYMDLRRSMSCVHPLGGMRRNTRDPTNLREDKSDGKSFRLGSSTD